MEYSGGTIIATKRTTATFGEYEPEFVEFTPLSKLTSRKALDIASNPASSEEAKVMALSSLGSGKTGSCSNPKTKTDYSFSGMRNQSTSVPGSNKENNNLSGKFVFEMLLSPDLETRIIEYSLRETADVIMNVLREQQ